MSNPIGGGDWAAAADVGEGGNQDIFRVWTLASTNRPDFADNPPLTAAARTTWQAYDSTDDPALRCQQLGMPRVITQTGPHPVAFEQRGDDIVLRGEYFDVERLIHMGEQQIPDNVRNTPLGYSVGRWEDGTLVVNTARINYPYFDISGLAGIPQSRDVAIEERYYLSPDGTELHMDFSISDPAVFTETLTVENYQTWLWRPDIVIMPYACQTD